MILIQQNSNRNILIAVFLLSITQLNKMMQIIQQSTPKNQQRSRTIINNSQLSQITIDREQISLKQRIVEQLLSESDVQNHRSILERWPSQQFRNKLQNGKQGFQICRKNQNARYYGQVCNQMFHGYGLLIYQYQHQNNSIRFYQGDFQNNCKHGGGIQFINGDIYIGKYLNNKPEDHSAIFIWKNGDTFSGSFVNGMKHGHGRWVSGTDMYLGEWKFNKPDGQGIIKTPSSTYQGTVRNGYKHNSGAQIFSNGDRYNGFYANGKPQGEGTYYWNNGAIYKGQFKNGLRYGYGEWRYNTERYEGYYVNDKRNGHGLYTWQGGSFYKGEFQDDLRHGFGQMHWNEESYYAGNWRQGSQDGQGQLWQFGKLVKKGLFQNGKLIKEHHQHGEHHQNHMHNVNHNNSQQRDYRLKSIKNPQKDAFNKKVSLNNRYVAEQNKSKSPPQREQNQQPSSRKTNGVKSAFSNQTKISKIAQSDSSKDRHIHNRNIPKQNEKVNLPKHLYTPSQGNKSFFEGNYSSKTKIDKLYQKQNKVNQSYNQQHMRRHLKHPIVTKSTAVDSFSQTHLSPIKWNNFKHIKGQQYQQNGKLPNIY